MLYVTQYGLPSINPIKEKIWEVLAPSKIKMFLWKTVSGAIPVAERLATRGVKIDPRCLACGFEGESINHVLFLCTLARQTWALSNIPSLVDGFAEHSLYHNIFHVISMSRNAGLPTESRRTVPWIIWTLWKNRNNLIFDGKVFHQFDLLAKIKDDSDHWFLAQQVQKDDEQNTSKASAGIHKVWKPPDNPWLKCNIASSWDKHNKVGGAAWVLRNSLGVVLLHSRCSFSEIETKQDAELRCWLWALESMHNLKIRNLLLAAEEKYLMDAVLRHAAWPSFYAQSESLLFALSHIPRWQIMFEERCANKGSFLIAQSVTREDRRQSYVATGYPFWLHELFSEEMYTT